MVKIFQKPINPAKCSPNMENIISVINHDSKRCNLCSTKKYHILTSLVDLINWRTDFISKCRHCDKNIIYFYYIHIIYIFISIYIYILYIYIIYICIFLSNIYICSQTWCQAINRILELKNEITKPTDILQDKGNIQVL